MGDFVEDLASEIGGAGIQTPRMEVAAEGRGEEETVGELGAGDTRRMSGGDGWEGGRWGCRRRGEVGDGEG